MRLELLGDLVGKGCGSCPRLPCSPGAGPRALSVCLCPVSPVQHVKILFLARLFLLAEGLPFLERLCFAVIDHVRAYVWDTCMHLHLFVIFILFVSSSGFKMECREASLSCGVPCDYSVPYTMGPACPTYQGSQVASPWEPFGEVGWFCKPLPGTPSHCISR